MGQIASYLSLLYRAIIRRKKIWIFLGISGFKV